MHPAAPPTKPGSRLKKDRPILLERDPTTQEEVKLVNDSLASAIAGLSVEEEELILFDLYGLPPGLGFEDGEEKSKDESKAGTIAFSEQLPVQREAIHNLKKAVERQLERGVHGDFQKAYEFTMKSNPYFLQRQGHLFIASVKEGGNDNFDAAAEMLLNHLKIKSELFPAGTMGRHIRWNDLSLKDQDVVSSGCLQFASHPDASGRVVLHCSVHPVMQLAGREFNDTTACSLARAMWYIVLLEAQTNLKMTDSGVVINICNICNTTLTMQSHQLLRQRLTVIPFRLRAVHVFYTCSALRASYSLRELISCFHFVPARRYRYRAHYAGSVSALKEQMAGFGISAKDSPWKNCETDFSRWSRKSYLEWLEHQKAREQNVISGKDTAISEIQPFDVLLGRSKMAREHPGNRRCKGLVDLQHGAYESSDVKGRNKIAREVVEAIYKAGGRFLRFESGEWIEVSPDVARQKIGHDFRFLRNKGRLETGAAAADTFSWNDLN